MSKHEHNWEPMFRWTGRYRCSICKAIGYRAVSAGQDFIRGYKPDSIHHYKCGRCGGPAIGKTKNKSRAWFCAKHKPKDYVEDE